jgi:hypothetical protein
MRVTRLAVQTCVVGLLFLPCIGAQDADKQVLIDIEQEYASSAPLAPGAPTPAQKYMYDGPLMQLSAAGTYHVTSKSEILNGRGRGRGAANPAEALVKRETHRENFHVEIYSDTGLIGYNETITESGHQDPALNKIDYHACLDTFVKRDGKWYGISNACAPSKPPSGN